MTGSPKKVAIIGGGVGAITAAYAITQLPNWQDEYDITLYQLGWRLGGKGASGRNMKKGGRIEEHGLHIWAGFYDNGFRLMRDCYEQLNKTGLRSQDAPLGTLEKAFSGLNHFMLAEEVPNADGEKELHPWRIDFEQNYEKPGSGKVVPSPFALFQEFMEFVLAELEKILDEADHKGHHPLPARFHLPLAARFVGTRHRTPLHALRHYSKSLPENSFDHNATHHATMSDLARHAQKWFHDANLHKAATSDGSRRMHLMVSLSMAFFRGALDNDVFRDGFDAIDDMEISDWLLKYDAAPEAVYSAVFRGCYDYVFGYPGGITDHRRSVGAGTAIRGLLRLAFCYKGSLFYKMMAGMGDTIFGPYYQILKHRGVKFKFFNAATNLRLDDSGNGIAAIEMVEQAAIKGGRDYDPLIDVQGLPCWPSEPLWEQLENVAQSASDRIDFECEQNAPTGRPYSLERGRDFDLVILGASIGSLHYMTSELARTSNRWAAMLDKVETVATHAAQFWMDTTPEDLGWNALVAKYNDGDQSDLRTVMTSAPEPLDTWADMTDLIDRENWPEPRPRSIAYFCSPAHDVGNARGAMAERTKLWADETLVRLWPGSKKDGEFDATLLHDTDATTGREKFDNQYFRENLFGSERYVMSVPNSVQYRLPPDGSGFENLYLAGDWTRCGINAGCVEAATISGLACARGLTGADIEIVGEGDLANDAGPTDAAKLSSPYAQTAPWPLTPMFGTGQIDGFFSFHAVNAEALEKVLPKGMSLHPQTLTPDGTHPVTVLCNQQMGVRASIMPKLLAIPNYYEAIIAINFVQIEGQEGVFTYLPNLSLTNRLAELSGIIFYGYNKTIGRLSMGHNSYSVAGPQGKPIYSGHYNQRNFARPLTDFPTAGRVQALLEKVVVSQGKFGKWQYSSFDFNLTSAYVAGVHARIEVQDARLANLPKGVMQTNPIRIDGQQANPDNLLPGAFRIWTSWTLSNPLDSNRIARLATARSLLPRNDFLPKDA